MGAPETLIELAERCEQATGPDRELDIAILAAIDWREADWEAGDRTVRDMVERRGLSEFAARADEGLSVWRHLPRLTASLDAAMTLVPEGWEWAVSKGSYATVGVVGIIDDRENTATAATPALALCAAALRARAASEPPHA